MDAQNTKLFAHHIWKASILLGKHLTEEMDAERDLKGKSVLEFGAAAGIPSIICARMGCKVTASDYPDENLITILKRNLAINTRSTATDSREDPEVIGHIWGERNDEFYTKIGETKFDYILLADTLWMAHQHENLLDDLKEFLSPQGRIIGAAGLHTGFKTLYDFFKLASSERYGFNWNRKLYRIPLGHGFCEDMDWEMEEGEDCIVDEAGERSRWLFKFEMTLSSHGKKVTQKREP